MKQVTSAGGVPNLGITEAIARGNAKGPTDVAISLLAPTVLAIAAAAIAFAPVAAADDDTDDLSGPDIGSSQQAGGPDDDVTASGPARKAPAPAGKAPKPNSVSDVPKGWSNEALWSDQVGGGSNPFGSLPKPPVFALD